MCSGIEHTEPFPDCCCSDPPNTSQSLHLEGEFVSKIILSKPIKNRYFGHVTGYQPISDQYFLIRSVPELLCTFQVKQADSDKYQSADGSSNSRAPPKATTITFFSSVLCHFRCFQVLIN